MTMPIDAALIVSGLADATCDANANALTVFQPEGMANVADFAHMTDKDIVKMCKAMNARATDQNGHQIGASKVKRVRALANWALHLRNMQLPINNDGFDEAALDTAMILLDTDNPPKVETG